MEINLSNSGSLMTTMHALVFRAAARRAFSAACAAIVLSA
jgi:hypothetical protein